MFTLIAQIVQGAAPLGVTVPVPEVAAAKTIAITDFTTAFGTWQISLIAIFLAADIILGIAAAIAAKKFNFNDLATFMATGVLPYLLGFAVVQIVASGFGFYGEIAVTAVFVAIILNLSGSIISNLATLGVNMPRFLKKAT